MRFSALPNTKIIVPNNRIVNCVNTVENDPRGNTFIEFADGSGIFVRESLEEVAEQIKQANTDWNMKGAIL